MADIIINEISQNYSYVIGDSSYCCVALPITASWGPAYVGYDGEDDKEDVLEDVVWSRFRANSQGLESFVSTYRGPAANYRLSQDFSYQMAVSLLTAGYDVLVCRICPGSKSTSMLRRSYENKIADDWFDSAKLTGNLTLLSGVGSSGSDPIPFEVSADHTLIVSSTNPNFPGTTITALTQESRIQDSTKTGIYAIESSTNAGTIEKIIFHLKDTTEGHALWNDKSAWNSRGIKENDLITFTGDKDLETLNGSPKGTLTVTAKYPGTFGNRLQCSLRRMNTVGIDYWNLVVYVVDSSGVRIAVENLNFVFDVENSTDNVLFIEEIESQFVDITAENLDENSYFIEPDEGSTIQDKKMTIVFAAGQDKGPAKTVEQYLDSAVKLAADRYNTQVFPVTDDQVDQFTGTTNDPIQRGSSFELSHVPAPAKVVCRYDGTTLAAADFTLAIETTGTTVTINDNGTNPVPAAGVEGKVLEVSYTYNSEDKIESNIPYVEALCEKYNHSDEVDSTTAATWEYLEWLFTRCIDVYGLLHDKLAYNPNRVISPGWDDQDFLRLSGNSSYPLNITTPSPIHLSLMETAYHARCATAYIDLPKSLAKKYVSDDSQQADKRGYAQLLARQDYADSDGLFTTHSALFGPWGTYMYVGTSKQQTASPSFLALMIQRSMILNQSLQYEWIQPSSRKNKVNIGKMDYTVSKKYLDIWQPDPDTEGGVGVNAIANIPDLGLSIWGDSTLYENPPATYQALRNLSTRLLVNAIKNVVYKVGISITFQYTNQTAFSSFYVGVTPILDSMVNAGAIGDYKVVIGNDFDAVGMVKANSCVGKIYITPNGTIQHITVDLIALPPQTDLSNYS